MYLTQSMNEITFVYHIVLKNIYDLFFLFSNNKMDIFSNFLINKYLSISKIRN